MCYGPGGRFEVGERWRSRVLPRVDSPLRDGCARNALEHRDTAADVVANVDDSVHNPRVVRWAAGAALTR